MKIALCMATRGILNSRTIESVLDNLEEVSNSSIGSVVYEKFFFTHNLPIPESQNDMVKRALKWGAHSLWFVEEDMLIPPGTLSKMIHLGKEYVAVDYPVGEKRCGCIARKKGEILWSGLGCTLIHDSVFKKIEKPWFEIDRTVRITNEDPFEYVIDEGIPYKYGGHDILFGIKVREKGVEITQLKGVTAGHIKPVKTGRMDSNNGTHEFEVWNEIKQFQDYN